MVRVVSFLIVCCALIVVSGTVNADVPMPLHNIEGNSGVCLTSTAYLANPPKKGEVFGKPSFSISGVFGREKDLQSIAVTENILGKYEIGYAYERFGLGDWPDDVKSSAGASISQHLGLHNLNLRAMVIEEGSFDCSWMPAVTFGTHFKWNESTAKLNDDLGGLLDHPQGHPKERLSRH